MRTKALLALAATELLLLLQRQQVVDGGPGSGNFGHAGRPGQVGGSSSGGGHYGDPVSTTYTAKFRDAKPKEFRDALIAAKETILPDERWRVHSYDEDEYADKQLFVTDGGSTVAVTSGKDIISVCKNDNSGERGSDLIKKAVEAGGDRLDAFGPGLYRFYTKNGFEPVSVAAFDEEYAPHDWVKGRDDPEPIIFYKYVGKRYNKSYDEFVASVKMQEYDAAAKERDDSIGGSK